MASDGLVPDAGTEEPLYYGCPYPACDFVSDNIDEVATHISDTHADEDEFLPPIEIGAVDEGIDEEGKGVYMDYLRQKRGRSNEGDKEEKELYINSSLPKDVRVKPLPKSVSKSIYKTGKNSQNEELESSDGGSEKIKIVRI